MRLRAIAITSAVAALGWTGAPGASALPSSLGLPAAPAPFVVHDGMVTIVDLDVPVTVGMDDLRQAEAAILAASGRSEALGLLESLPHDLGLAAAWDLAHGEDALPPEDDVDRAAGQDPDPVPSAEPAQALNAAESANYTTPSPVCTWHQGSDTRQMNAAITRYTLYRFNLRFSWRGCDDGSNNTAEPVDASYNVYDPFIDCIDDGTLPRHAAGPYGAPFIEFDADGECLTGFKAFGKDWGVGHTYPQIHDTYDWTGRRTQRTGSAR
jgi:hypothetical protein